jgi:hypothetical protein
LAGAFIWDSQAPAEEEMCVIEHFPGRKCSIILFYYNFIIYIITILLLGAIK